LPKLVIAKDCQEWKTKAIARRAITAILAVMAILVIAEERRDFRGF
jgi:hypothetical protein